MTSRRSICTTLAFALPLLILVVGVIAAANRPLQESDWFAFGKLFTFLAALVLAALVSLVFSTLAHIRREPRAGISLIGAVPAALAILAAVVIVSTAFQNEAQNEARNDAHKELVARLVADPVLRRQLVSEQPLEPSSTRALLSYEARDLLTPTEIAQIWEQRKDIDTGLHYAQLIGPAYTPEHVLRAYFDRSMAAELRRSGERSYRGLRHDVTFLGHRNLPQDIIDEILAGGHPTAVEYLQRNPRLTSNPAYLKRWVDVPPQ